MTNLLIFKINGSLSKIKIQDQDDQESKTFT